MTTEMTDQGEQIVLPGAERSAHQAAAARGAKSKPKVKQLPPGGLFETRAEQIDLFTTPTAAVRPGYRPPEAMMQVQLTTSRGIPVCKTVTSYQEASEAVRAFIGNRGASQCPRDMGLIADGGKIVARVSYNGRVWKGKEYKPGAIKLYDPCPTNPY
jgi:hypothetical protein